MEKLEADLTWRVTQSELNQLFTMGGGRSLMKSMAPTMILRFITVKESLSTPGQFIQKVSLLLYLFTQNLILAKV